MSLPVQCRECDIELEVPLPNLETIFSGVKVYVDDGFRTSIEAKGHGLQRSLIFAILRVYAELIRKGSSTAGEKEKSMIFAIEEPELYLHPQAQRLMMQVLREIAEGRNQIIYSTHSSIFVDITYFDEICLMRRETIGGKWKSTITQLSMEDMITDLKSRYPQTTPTPESMRERYSHVYSTARNEGFFAKKIVLVEGLTEEYALPIYSKALRYNMDIEGVSVINSGDKNQIDRLYRVFNEFRIPCYIVFDGDKDSEDANIRRATRDILELVGWTQHGLLPTTVEDKFTVFENEFEKTMRTEISEYDTLVQEARKKLGIKTGAGEPLIARYLAKKLVDKGIMEGDSTKYVPSIIQEIVGKIKELKWESSILKSA